MLRTMFNRGTTGARSALNISIVRPHRRGFAASMGNVSMQVPRAVSPLLTGILFAANNLALPFFIGAAFQAAYLAMYYSSFRWVDDAISERHTSDLQVTPPQVAADTQSLRIVAGVEPDLRDGICSKRANGDESNSVTA